MPGNSLASLLGRAAALGVAGSAAMYGVNKLIGRSEKQNAEDTGRILNEFNSVIPPDYAKSLQVMETMKAGLPDSVAFLASNAKGQLLALDTVSGDTFTYDIAKSRVLDKLRMDAAAKRRFGRYINQREKLINESMPLSKVSEDERAISDYIRLLRSERSAYPEDIPDVRHNFVGDIIENIEEDEAARLRRAYKLAIGLGSLALFGAGAAGSRVGKMDNAKIMELLSGMKAKAGKAIETIKPKAEQLSRSINTSINELV